MEILVETMLQETMFRLVWEEIPLIIHQEIFKIFMEKPLT